MSKRLNLEQEVRAMAVAVLEQRLSALTDSGLRATVKLKQWSSEGRDSSEIEIVFWRGNNLIDVIENFIVDKGRPVASTDEFRLWLEQSVEAVMQENGPGSGGPP
ncbi:MAG: hypothetical protein QOJ97_1907 [Solirubrobacteraceae bacterium]|jgi:hypothetical protein|nr:hypothetical protein [Solirubrobacteraceae bacterium]